MRFIGGWSVDRPPRTGGTTTDMTILFLVIGGNLLVFYGFFSLLGRYVFKEEELTPEKFELEMEMKRIERELRRF